MNKNTKNYKELISNKKMTSEGILFREHLLSILGEEGAEVIQAISKANRFGIHTIESNNKDEPNNSEKIVQECYDFIAVLEMLIEIEALPKLNESDIETWKQNKKERVIKYFKRFGKDPRKFFE